MTHMCHTTDNAISAVKNEHDEGDIMDDKHHDIDNDIMNDAEAT